MSKRREFALGRWINARSTASVILSERNPLFPTAIYRLVRVTVAEVKVQAARERVKKGRKR